MCCKYGFWDFSRSSQNAARPVNRAFQQEHKTSSLFQIPYLQHIHPKNPLISPLYADLTGLPPIRIHVGDDEILLDDSRRYFERALAAGVDAALDIWMGMPHGFVTNIIDFNAAAQAHQETGAFLERVLSESPHSLRKEIRRRAYEIYLGRGREPGHEIDDWLQAERELTTDRSKAANK
jgi:acetyl esterase/lipase